jgi:GNAT superfamily N-acetyltransferase
MGRRLRPMTAADLDLLPEPCGRCAFWETSVADLAAPADHPDRAARKAEWAEEVTAHWGYCGVLAVHDDEVIGFLTLAPARLVRRLPAFSTTPASADVAMLLSAQVTEAWRGKGIGRQLVSTAAGLVARRDIRALEAVGTRRDGPSCMMPVGWLETVGFGVVREHPVTPRLRMDLHATQRWTGLGAAWNRLTGLVAPPVAPEPAAYASRSADVTDPRPSTAPVQAG